MNYKKQCTLITLLAVLIFCVFMNSCSSDNKDYNLLIITVDTQRADRLGCYGNEEGLTPNADKLAKEGVLFENAFTTVPMTLPAHASLFTSLYPQSHGARENTVSSLDDGFTTLAEILSDKGFNTAAITAAIVVNSGKGLAQGFDYYDDKLDVDEKHANLPDAPYRRGVDVAEKAVKWLKGRPEGNFFLWAHFFDPHFPYNAPSQYAEKYGENSYEGEVAYADYCVGTVLDYLEKEKLLEKTIIVYLGDHGESLGEHGEDTHGYFAYNSTIKIPMIIKEPDRQHNGIKRSYAVSIIDIFPTVLDILGIPEPDGIEGKSLVPLIEENTKIHDLLFFESMQAYIALGWSALAGSIQDNWKYIRSGREELYNLAVDGGEQNNLAVGEKDRTESFFSVLCRDYLSKKPAFISDEQEISAEEQEKLASLGYLGGGNSADVTAEAEALFKGPDMGDNYPLWQDYFDALGELRNNRTESARQMLLEILDKSGGHNYGIYRWLANIATLSGEYDEALGYLEKLKLQKNGAGIVAEIENTRKKRDDLKNRIDRFNRERAEDNCNVMAYVNLARYYAENELSWKAVALFEEAMEKCGKSAKLCNSFGIALSMSGQEEDGIKMFKKAIEINPDHIEAYLNLSYAFIQKGDFSEAEHYLKLAAMIEPQNPKLFELKKLLSRQ